jgi:predicted house-cleaning NTP pyrophosphatase (Maf/HAM1 superfamily)
MIGRLHGRKHEGRASLWCAAMKRTGAECTLVYFQKLSPEDIEQYGGESLDKAGAYGIQGSPASSSAGSRAIIRAWWLPARLRLLSEFA